MGKDLENKLVVKHNRLVDFRGSLNTNELKLFSIIMANVHEYDLSEKSLKDFKIDVNELKEERGIGGGFHRHLKEIAFGLEQKKIEVTYKENGHEKTLLMRLIYRPIVSGSEDTLEFQLDKLLIPYILEFKNQGYMKYLFQNIMKMRSNYSIRIYELMKQLENFKDGSRYFKIDELRVILGLEGDEYPQFKEFNKNVLQKAKDEINAQTDIQIDYEFEKKSRKVVGVKMMIKDVRRAPVEEGIDKEEYYDTEQLKKQMWLENESFSPKQIIELYEIAIDKTAIEDIVDAFRYVQMTYSWVKSRDGVRNTYGYLRDALEQDLGRMYIVLKMEAQISEKNDREAE